MSPTKEFNDRERMEALKACIRTKDETIEQLRRELRAVREGRRNTTELLHGEFDNPPPGMVRTEHGWARPCSLCGSTDFGKPCPRTTDGFHATAALDEDA